MTGPRPSTKQPQLQHPDRRRNWPSRAFWIKFDDLVNVAFPDGHLNNGNYRRLPAETRTKICNALNQMLRMPAHNDEVKEIFELLDYSELEADVRKHR